MKTLRFAVTTSIGLLTANSPTAGILSSAVDSFLLNKLFPDRSPRLFMNQIKSVIVKSKPENFNPIKPTMSGRDRNRHCSCGSGKKYKNCCGR
jgi:hypothetical protein